MKNIFTPKFLIFFSYILIIGQLWVNVFSHVDAYFNKSGDSIELAESNNDIESEKEKDNNEDEILFSAFITPTNFNNLNNYFIHTEDILSINLIEINTPPPKHTLFIS